MKKTFQKELKSYKNTEEQQSNGVDDLSHSFDSILNNGAQANIECFKPSSDIFHRATPSTPSKSSPSAKTSMPVLELEATNQLASVVDLTYLKHVIFKFLTSREYEVNTGSSIFFTWPLIETCSNLVGLSHIFSQLFQAQQLTRAVATLLRFSPEEENLLKEHLEWKMSWFGSKPQLGSGQFSLSIDHTT